MVSIRLSVLAAVLLCASASVAQAATVTFDCTKVPNICSNDCYALQCLGKPSTLHRDSNDSAEHRTENACNSPNRCSGNPSDSNSCDEYPYASSQEGGSGAVTRCVPSHENSVQGGTLSSFYSRNDIGDGDEYMVAFSSTSGLEYCDGSCDNSGDELVRRAIALQGRSEAANLYNKRHFLLEDGQDILVFERKAQPASLDKLVGTQTYLAHEDRSVKIVKAL